MIAFDDEKTNLDVIMKALRAGDFAVQDKPVYLKAFPAETQSN
ncbi:MAG TPA: hypothetical protein PLQ77_03915 [Smithellaceae bacterium]|nr:hypothetical protein [Smithellaceae bacterium]HOQ71453.1 hypothetical protein [Smithellaceae bacterium]HPL09856.1 hypothetical protein [Smithellaceae bacterium]